MRHLMLARHGQSEWNRIGRIQGQTDTPLTEVGYRQAQSMARFLAHKLEAALLRIHTSPMLRARQTAEVIAEAMRYPSVEITVDERLNDFDLGEIAGAFGWERVAASHPELAYLRLNDPLNFHPPGGESGAQFRDRLADFLRQDDDEGVIELVVSHGVVNKFIRAIRLGLHGADIIALDESQASVYELRDAQEIEHLLEE